MAATLPTTPACTLSVIPTDPDEIIYPESDGKPMADNTQQFRYIVTIQRRRCRAIRRSK